MTQHESTLSVRENINIRSNEEREELQEIRRAQLALDKEDEAQYKLQE